MVMLTGCVSIRVSNFLLNSTLKINNNIIPASSGSVGRNISIGKLRIISLSGMESGAINAMTSISLSSARNANPTRIMATGNRLSKVNSL